MTILIAFLCAQENSAVKPVPKDTKRHDGFVALAKQGGIDLLFLGDSITDGWRGAGKKVWEQYFAPLKAANFGISGDRTEHVLWRLQNGELEGIRPRLVVLMIGTNNIGHKKNSPEQTAEGVLAILREIMGKLSGTKILLLGVFPREAKPGAMREKVKAINNLICKFDDGKLIRYLDISEKFLDSDGMLPKDLMPDALHPNEKGYRIWAESIKDVVAEMMTPK